MNLAINLNAMGRYDDAEPLFRKALEVKGTALGDSHPEVAEGYLGLGTCLLDQGRYAAAEALFRKALDVNRKALGEGHPGTAKSYYWLAGALLKLGRYTEAETLLRQTLRVRRETLGLATWRPPRPTPDWHRRCAHRAALPTLSR